jgi:hypothetical protein
VKFVLIQFSFLALLISCEAKKDAGLSDESSELSLDIFCQGNPKLRNGYRIFGESSESDEIGIVRRYEYYKTQNSEECKQGQIPLSRFEQGIRRRAEKNIKCVPQTELSEEVYLKASNNFYDYRNDKYFLHLDPETGIYKRILLGEDKNGNPAHIKEIGCFWARKDNETELWDSQDYGLQILIDQANAASSNNTKSEEVYKITKLNDEWTFLGVNETQTWSELFCPSGSTPWGYCDLLRNGNLMFEPKNLSAAQKNDLINQAVLIRAYISFSEALGNEFHSKWSEAFKYEGEMAEMDFKYRITFAQDVPRFTFNAVVDYVRDLRPMMPEGTQIDENFYCYQGFKDIVLTDSSTGHIWGEICSQNGDYTFTEL